MSFSTDHLKLRKGTVLLFVGTTVFWLLLFRDSPGTSVIVMAIFGLAGLCGVYGAMAGQGREPGGRPTFFALIFLRTMLLAGLSCGAALLISVV